MIKPVLLFLVLCLPAVVPAQDDAPGLLRTYTVGVTVGFTSTFQPPLGPTFGAGPDVEDKFGVSLNNTFRKDDSVTLFAWSTTDMPSRTPDWMAGMLYTTPLIRHKNHTLTVTGGLQRWMLTNVASGSNDWLLSGNLTYGTKLKNIPIFVSEDSWSLLSSTLPKGSAIYTRVYTQHILLHRESFQLLLRQGPEQAYSWGFYGLQGECVVRYAGSLVAVWKGNAFQAGYGQQFGQQAGIPSNRFWSFAIAREITRPFPGHGL